MKEWPKFKAGDRVWSVLRNCWVELEELRPLGLYDGDCVYDAEGKMTGSNSPFPLLFLNEVKPEDWPQPEPPRPNLEVDAPVMVSDPGNSRWFKRHFAAWHNNGRIIICWDNGCTSFTSKDKKSWEYWRLPTEEELKGGFDV